MPIKIFTLRNVPDDEVSEIKQLLSDNAILFYETPAGNWGISSPSIWLEHDEDEEKAKALIHKYQANRHERARADYQEQKQQGSNKTLLDSFKQNPARFIFYIMIVSGLIYISTVPFVNFILD